MGSREARKVGPFTLLLCLAVWSAPVAAQKCCCFIDDDNGDFVLECINLATRAQCLAQPGGAQHRWMPDWRCVAAPDGDMDQCKKKGGAKKQQCTENPTFSCILFGGPTPVPTLSGWGMVVLMMFVIAGGLLVLRRQSAPG